MRNTKKREVDEMNLSEHANSAVTKTLWIDRLDECLTDDFRYKLYETLTKSVWNDVQYGLWDDPIRFFEYLDRQILIVNQIKGRPSQ